MLRVEILKMLADGQLASGGTLAVMPNGQGWQVALTSPERIRLAVWHIGNDGTVAREHQGDHRPDDGEDALVRQALQAYHARLREKGGSCPSLEGALRALYAPVPATAAAPPSFDALLANGTVHRSAAILLECGCLGTEAETATESGAERFAERLALPESREMAL